MSHAAVQLSAQHGRLSVWLLDVTQSTSVPARQHLPAAVSSISSSTQRDYPFINLATYTARVFAYTAWSNNLELTQYCVTVSTTHFITYFHTSSQHLLLLLAHFSAFDVLHKTRYTSWLLLCYVMLVDKTDHFMTENSRLACDVS